jgi:hypothetical protein
LGFNLSFVFYRSKFNFWKRQKQSQKAARGLEKSYSIKYSTSMNLSVEVSSAYPQEM